MRRPRTKPATSVGERLGATSSAVGVAAAGALWLAPTLTRGGLAPIALAAVTALVVGVPAALGEWRSPPHPERVRDPGVRAAVSGLAEVTALLLAASALAWLAAGSWAGLAAALVAWPIGAALARRPSWLGAPAGLAVLALLVVASARGAAAPPWTLLQPEWRAWAQFAGPAVVGGLWLAGVGTGRWSLGAPRPPGARRAPFAVAGLGIALAAVIALDRAALFESSLGATVRSPLSDAVLGLAAISLAGATCYAPRSSARRSWPRPVLGLALTAALVGVGEHALPWVWGTLVPALTAVGAAAVAARTTWADRTAAAIGALACAAAVVAGWPGLPGHLLDAVLVGVLLVVSFWYVATRSVLARRTP